MTPTAGIMAAANTIAVDINECDEEDDFGGF